jgi:hypothetical protein
MTKRNNPNIFLSVEGISCGVVLAFGSGIASVYYQNFYIAVLGTLIGLGPFLSLFALIGFFRCHSIYQQFAYRINFTCPKCAWQASPLFICPECDKNVGDLQPSTYGVFYAGCPHCSHSLPTVDFLGRLELDIICQKCSADLSHDDLGKKSEYRFGVIGSASSGKTNVMITAISSFEQDFAPANKLEVDFGNQEEESNYRNYVEQLNIGRVMKKTVRSTPVAFSLSIQPENSIGCLLYIYDAAGEDFEEDEGVLEKHPIELYDGIIFVVDPFAEEGVKAGLVGKFNKNEIELNEPAEFNASEVLGRLINVLERVLKVNVGRKLPLCLAVVVTKIDAFDCLNSIKKNDFGGWHYTMNSAALDAEFHSPRIRSFLQKAGMGNFLKLVESRFARVAFFGVSALGRAEDPFNNTPFKSFGVSAPLVWLAFYTGALTDEDSWERSFANAHIHFIRSLRGVEGPKSLKQAWLVFLFLATTFTFFAFVLWFSLPPLLLALSVGIPAVGLSFLYIWMFAALVLRRFV